MSERISTIIEGDGPIVVAAVHDGHMLRDELMDHIALSDSERLREEDPYTGGWTHIAANRIQGTHSRFQVDLNRPRDGAVYLKPEDAWGLNVWKGDLPADVADRSRAEYDAFYADVRRMLEGVAKRHRHFFVFDLHTYNHRRDGADAAPADPEANPEVNLGTATMDRAYWAPVVDRFINDLRAADFLGRQLDVRENVKFKGGQFGRWIHENFPGQGCAIAIEFKKFFMDEWTGEADTPHLDAIQKALSTTVPGILEELRNLGAGACDDG